ncbi:unnamed protein product [Linum tenue]|uniref:S-protein homolog n=1 Tax=Linum tenue TaxID=586396 RepID=A0AAV0RJT7_9ROSI|nr:unnamed protein product [Linum tenue]
MNAAAALLLITAVSTILTTATGQPDDVAQPEWSLWPYKHVHISNELGSSVVMTVHCRGKRFLTKTKDLGVQYVGDGGEYTWRFKPGFFGVTKYPCHVTAVHGSQSVHVDFVSYSSRSRHAFVEHKNNVYWAVKRTGVYARDVTKGASGDVLKYVWVHDS